MPRQVRRELAGAIYHVIVMNRRHRRKAIFRFSSGFRCQSSLFALFQREETTMSLVWIAEQLHMGSWSNVSNLLRKTKNAKSED